MKSSIYNDTKVSSSLNFFIDSNKQEIASHFCKKFQNENKTVWKYIKLQI